MKAPLTSRQGFKLPVSFNSFHSLRYLFHFSLVMISSSFRKTFSSANEYTQHRKQKYRNRQVNTSGRRGAKALTRYPRFRSRIAYTVSCISDTDPICRPPSTQGGRARRHQRQIPLIHTALLTSHSNQLQVVKHLN